MNIDKYCKTILNELERVLGEVDSEFYYVLADLILDAKRVFLAGAGRSGLMIKAFATRLMQLKIKSFVVGEVTTPAIGEGDLLIISSASGETNSMVIAAQKAKGYSAEVALITAYTKSTIAKFADLSIRVPAPTPKVEDKEQIRQSVQQLGTLFEQSLLLFLDIIVQILMEKTNKTPNDMFAYHANLE